MNRMRKNSLNIQNRKLNVLIILLGCALVNSNANQLCTYYPNYPNATETKVVGCKETCCPNNPKNPSDACCRFKYFNFDAESVAVIVITVVAFLVFNIVIITILVKIYFNWKRKRTNNLSQRINIPNSHVISQQHPSNSYPMADMTSPPSYHNIAVISSNTNYGNSQIPFDKQSIETDYLPKYDYLALSANIINNSNTNVSDVNGTSLSNNNNNNNNSDINSNTVSSANENIESNVIVNNSSK